MGERDKGVSTNVIDGRKSRSNINAMIKVDNLCT